MKTLNIILIGTVAIVIALVLGYVAFVKPELGEPVQVPVASDDSVVNDENNEIADWLIYRNEEIGIEFKYPSIFGEPKIVKVKSPDKKHLDVVSGERIRVSFGNSKYGYIYFTAHTSDYEGFIDFGSFIGNDNIVAECPNPLEYSNKGDVCKIIEIDGEKAIWKNYFSEIDCSFSSGTKIYFNNKEHSHYSGLSFLFHLENTGHELNRLYNNCTDEEGNKKAYSKAVDISRGIMEEKNLSDNDLEKIEIVNEMIKSFEFIEKDETADWLTYENEKYDYKVKYPKDWNFEIQSINEDSQRRVVFDNKKDDENHIAITIDPNNTLEKISKELSSIQIHNAPPITQEKTKFHGLDAIYSTGDLLGYEESIFFEYNKKLFKVEYYTGKIENKNDYELDIYNKIMDSFEFIE